MIPLQKNENYFQSCQWRASISSPHIALCHLIFEFKQHTRCALILINCRPTRSTGCPKVHNPPAVLLVLSYVRIKFGKCAHSDISPRTQLRKIHPPRIGLKRLPETVERFVARRPHVCKVYMRPCRGSCITLARISIAASIISNLFRTFDCLSY